MQIIFPNKDPKSGLYPTVSAGLPTKTGAWSGYNIEGVVQDGGRKYCCFSMPGDTPKVYVEEVATTKASFFCFEDLKQIDDPTYKEVTRYLQNLGILGL